MKKEAPRERRQKYEMGIVSQVSEVVEFNFVIDFMLTRELTHIEEEKISRLEIGIVF